ncbi:flavin reductase family protein [Desulfonema magnum]|uniref:FMN-binding protein n=1 Tax=Desulfonema magnum TaxID=45655 RepID=A0A975GQ59_9BACT|nr:flavin reductase family protein [Desulfonema magnum]QTA89711.1 FMN-binding protein [Desulfonema magnum]
MIFKPFMREGFIPLPVAFISTISNQGIRNIAPYSCIMPVLRPLDLMCVASAKKRDTLVNIRENREFVINLPGTDFTDKVIPTAKFSKPEVDEFKEAGLEEKPSEVIKAPGIAGCYAWMECELYKEYEEEQYVLIMGKVLRLEVADEFLSPDGSLDVRKAKPLMMTGSKKGMHFNTVSDIDQFEPFSAMFPDNKDALASKYNH